MSNEAAGDQGTFEVQVTAKVAVQPASSSAVPVVYDVQLTGQVVVTPQVLPPQAVKPLLWFF